MLALKHDLPKPSRRGFLIGAATAGAGLTIGIYMPPGRARADVRPIGSEAAGPFSSYIRIAPDNTVTVLSSQMDGGQGSYTGIATLVAEELDADWGQMRVEGAAGNPKLYGNPAWGGAAQGTGGSTSIAGSWNRYRQVGATARAMLVEAAARDWSVPAGEIKVENGTISHPSGKSATFGELADKAALIPPPDDVKLKDPSAWIYIGNEKLRRLDSVTKTTGSHQFPSDVQLPGMLTAVIEHPPLFGAKVKSFDASAAKQVKGVVEVVETPRGVAVVGIDTWSAIKGRQALKVEWDETRAETRSTDALMAEYKGLARSNEAAVARNDGNAPDALNTAAKVVEAEFEFPYLAHAAMEPLDAVARFENGRCEIWAGHQLPDLYQAVAAKIMGIELTDVKLHVMTPGGFFGRRAVADADIIVEVVSTLKAIEARAPVKVQWTREDDTRGGRYRPMYYHKLRAGLDTQGNLVAWQHRIVGQSILKGTPFEAAEVKLGIDGTSVEGASTLPYAIPNLLVDLVTTDVGVPVLWWRSVGSTHTAYSTEVFLDEVAHAVGKDPVEFRRTLLKDQPRHLGVLNLAAEKAGWGGPASEGHFRGVAVHKSFGTYVAQVAEISLRESGGIKVAFTSVTNDAIVEGEVMDPGIVAEAIKGLLHSSGIKTKKLVVAVGGRDVIIKKITMDRMKEAEAREVIRWEAEQHVPFDMENVEIDFQILDPEGDGLQMTVLLVAAKRELVEHKLALLSDVGLEASVIDVDAFALHNAFEINYPEAMLGVVGLVNIGHETTNINILDDGVPILTRDIPIGTRRFKEDLQRERGLSADDADDVLRGARSAEALDPLLEGRGEELAVGIERAAAFLQSASRSAGGISRIYTTGGGARIPRLNKVLSDRLRMPVQLANPIEKLQVADGVFDRMPVDEVAPLLMLPIGLALRSAA